MAWYSNDILTLLQEGAQLKSDVAKLLGLSPKVVNDATRKLKARGYVQIIEGIAVITPSGNNFLLSGCKLKSGPMTKNAASRGKNTFRAKAWRAMRIANIFTVDDLLMMICNGTEKSPAASMQDYLRGLEGAGYLQVMPKRGTGRQPKRYRLRREYNTGPEAPAWNKPQRTLTDPNTGEVIYVPTINPRIAAGYG